ncbi:hypothetical protein ACFVZW_24895 [Streptomyces sp. NPDC059567]|uniref:hypothetical protein n=1 Tax=Streptomyces sp. NPDC059567 TaxID=3346867 RepID=UPI0036B352A9
MTASASGLKPASPSGWDARLYWQWIGYHTIAFVIVLTVGFVLALLGSDALPASQSLALGPLIATTPLTGRALLWVLAPSALTVPTNPSSP